MYLLFYVRMSSSFTRVLRPRSFLSSRIEIDVPAVKRIKKKNSSNLTRISENLCTNSSSVSSVSDPVSTSVSDPVSIPSDLSVPMNEILNVSNDENEVWESKKKNQSDTRNNQKNKMKENEKNGVGNTSIGSNRVGLETGNDCGVLEDKNASVGLLRNSNHIFPRNAPSRDAYSLKIMTYNVAGLRAADKNLNGGFLGFLKENDPDILCLQECKCEKSQIPFEVPKEYHMYFVSSAGKKGYAGTMVLSKVKPTSWKVEHICGNNEGRTIVLEFEKFWLVNNYIPNAGQNLERLNYRVEKWDAELQNYLRKLAQEKPIIWVGDLNVAHTSSDCYDDKKLKNTAGCTDEERASFGNFVKDFVDAYRHKYPNEKDGCYTYWSHFMNGFAANRGWRLDYFIMSPELKEGIVDVQPMRDLPGKKRGSDHCPLVLYLKL